MTTSTDHPFTAPEHFPSHSDWTEVLAPHFASEEFQSLLSFVCQQRQSQRVFPPAADVFRAFELCSFAETKIVILGQDPYHAQGQAHGLAFSVRGQQKLPPSLKNIYKELAADKGIENQSGDLTRWATQGVLLLNTVLTVREAAANSHRKKGWESFTDFVIQSVGQRTQPIVFILWGKPAATKRKFIAQQHCVIESAHPSPLSAYRGFFGSKPFSQANAAIAQQGRSPIDWQI